MTNCPGPLKYKGLGDNHLTPNWHFFVVYGRISVGGAANVTKVLHEVHRQARYRARAGSSPGEASARVRVGARPGPLYARGELEAASCAIYARRRAASWYIRARASWKS